TLCRSDAALLLENVDQRLASRGFGDVEGLAAAAHARLGKRRRNRLRAGFAGRGADDVGALAAQFECDRATDASGGAGDQGHLVRQVHRSAPHAIRFNAASIDAGSCTASTCSAWSIRETSFVSTLPGPHSITCVTPSDLILWTTSTHRTGP